jgi:hypothetical protein
MCWEKLTLIYDIAGACICVSYPLTIYMFCIDFVTTDGGSQLGISEPSLIGCRGLAL